MSERKYRKGEKGLETQERKFIASTKMARLLSKLTSYFNVEFQRPEFRPVFISKRLKKYAGQFCGNKIDIADEYKWSQKNTLWHEILHAVVYDNWQKVGLDWKYHKRVERAVFQLEGHGEHKSHSYKLSCDCGYWVKSVFKKQQIYCKHCSKTLVSPSEYRKIKKIADLKSRMFPIDVDNYKPWKDNKKIGLEI